jgi:ankyrin repeat protein
VLASLRGDKEIVQMLIDKGAQVDHKTKTGATALFAAASKGHCQIATVLLENGADPLVKDAQGRTACSYAKDYAVKSLLTSWNKKQ